MTKIRIILFLIILLLNFNLRGKIISYTAPIPTDAILAFKSEEYWCSEGWHAYDEHEAGRALENDTPVPWVDISPYISEANKLLGYIDIILTVKADKATDFNDPRWRLYGDADNRSWEDFRAVCDGKLYDMIDPTAKGEWETCICSKIKCGDYCILRFKVPSTIYNYYKIYLGRKNIRSERYNGDEYYANFYQVYLYVKRTTQTLIPHVDILNGKEYKQYYNDAYKAFTIPEEEHIGIKDIPITFDASKSIDTAGFKIIKYSWDFEGDGVYDLITTNPIATHIYTQIGTYQVILKIENENGDIAKNTGSCIATVSSTTLPFYITIINSIPEIILYQNAPNPFIKSKVPFTTIRFKIPKPTYVKLEIYDMEGNLIKTLLNEEKSEGIWETCWDGKDKNGNDVLSGIYFYKLETEYNTKIKVLTIVN